MRSLILILVFCLLVVANSLPPTWNPSLRVWNPKMGPYGAVNDSDAPSSIRVKRWGWGRRFYGGWGRGGGGWGRGGGGRRGGWGRRGWGK